MMTKLKQHWLKTSQREKWMIGLAGAVLLAFLFQQGILASLNSYQRQSEQKLRHAEQNFTALWQQQDRIGRLQITYPPQFKLSADRAVHESARQQKIAPVLLDANANQATLAPMTLPFPKLLIWLDLLEKQYGMQASHLKLSIDDDRPDQVHIATLVLQRVEGGIL